MPRFDIAHVREQGVDLVIVPLESSFGTKMDSEERGVIGELQMRSRAAGLAGTVVPVWDAGAGRMGFIAPQNWHSFFASINLQWVGININKELYW
jgi:hypothetical protein